MYNKRVKELKGNGKIPVQLRRKDYHHSRARRGRDFLWAAKEIVLTMLWSKTSLECSKASCCICRSSNRWNTSNGNWSNIWTITTTAESRQSWRACHLQFTDSKPFRLLEQFFPYSLSNFLGSLHSQLRRFLFYSPLAFSRILPFSPVCVITKLDFRNGWLMTVFYSPLI